MTGSSTLAAGDDAADWATTIPGRMSESVTTTAATRVRDSMAERYRTSLRTGGGTGTRRRTPPRPRTRHPAASRPRTRYVAASRSMSTSIPSRGRSGAPAYLAWSSETRSQLPPRMSTPASSGHAQQQGARRGPDAHDDQQHGQHEGRQERHADEPAVTPADPPRTKGANQRCRADAREQDHPRAHQRGTINPPDFSWMKSGPETFTVLSQQCLGGF